MSPSQIEQKQELVEQSQILIERGQVLFEFLISLFLVVILFAGAMAFIRDTWHRSQCLQFGFDQTHAALVGGLSYGISKSGGAELTAKSLSISNFNHLPTSMQIQHEKNWVSGIASCHSPLLPEKFQLPRLERFQ